MRILICSVWFIFQLEWDPKKMKQDKKTRSTKDELDIAVTDDSLNSSSVVSLDDSSCISGQSSRVVSLIPLFSILLITVGIRFGWRWMKILHSRQHLPSRNSGGSGCSTAKWRLMKVPLVAASVKPVESELPLQPPPPPLFLLVSPIKLTSSTKRTLRLPNR